jgi:energy-converting hydrogenase Eha subunit H
MNRIIVFAGVLFFVLLGCSDKQKEIEPKKIENNETKTESNETKIDTNATIKNIMVIEEEFIPEHIKHSHIEVVEHY